MRALFKHLLIRTKLYISLHTRMGMVHLRRVYIVNTILCKHTARKIIEVIPGVFFANNAGDFELASLIKSTREPAPCRAGESK